jgi:hypothetical protein
MPSSEAGSNGELEEMVGGEIVLDSCSAYKWEICIPPPRVQMGNEMFMTKTQTSPFNFLPLTSREGETREREREIS